ncbi:Voltage-gated Ion Channel (VIC) Superfamily [Thraustotheca clavata]|uniref:Voltage-gated Ion Channel (VIC) Superfamily n=1 Tax=Thraustotheca clavata TaxID=74557 RepID=A0A1W0A1J6_9STRA|nr:Voltage-gated Ion Channel (VIC) Superfamily [Thraustotheca clavata]
MPVYAAISPKYNAALSIEALHNAGLLTDTSMKMYTPQTLTRLNRFEVVFTFFTVPDSSIYSKIFHQFMGISALVSCASLFLRTLDGPNMDIYNAGHSDYPDLPNEATYVLLDGIFTAIFTIDLVIRLIIWPSMWKNVDVLKERRLLPFAKDIFNWFDVLALLPFYIDLVFGSGTTFVVLRLARLLRIFRLAKNNSGTYILVQAIIASIPAITIALIFLTEIVLFFSCLMLLFNPCSTIDSCLFTDLLTSAYFVVTTVATVGYGDIVPADGNILGRCTAILIMIVGTLFLSMPLAIVGTEFDRAWRDHTDKVVARNIESMHALAAGTSENQKKNDQVLEENPEILTKYMAPNSNYLRLAALTGEMTLIATTLCAELKNEMDVAKVYQTAQDLHAHMMLCQEKHTELIITVEQMVTEGDSSEAALRSSFRERIVQSFRRSMTGTLPKQVPTTAQPLKRNFRFRWAIMLFSIFILVLETMPDLQVFGENVDFCKGIAETYCGFSSSKNATQDPACYSTINPTVPLNFSCATGSDCFGAGNNFGSLDYTAYNCMWANDNFPFTGLGATQPFRSQWELTPSELPYYVCKRPECQRLHFYYVDGSGYWAGLEYIFFFCSVIEFISHLYFTGVKSMNWKNPYQWADSIAFIPFIVCEAKRYFMGIKPVYAIAPISNGVLTAMRYCRIFRFFQIQSEIPGTFVVREAISKTYRRLVIPYFMLALSTTIFAFLILQVEIGTECFIGTPCYDSSNNLITFPATTTHMPLGKRVLIDAKGNISVFEDVFSAVWFVIVTITSVGYGDMVPKTMPGKFIAVLAMIFGACYTAMPLTLVGSQFNRSYNDHKRREALTRTKIDVGSRLTLPSSDLATWKLFRTQNFMSEVQSMYEREFLSLLPEVEDDVVVQMTLSDEDRQVKIIIINRVKEKIEKYKARFTHSCPFISILQSARVVNRLYHEGIRLAKQQTSALHRLG